MMMHKALRPNDGIDKRNASRKEGGIWFVKIEDYLDASIQGLEDWIKKSNDMLITGAICSRGTKKNDKNSVAEMGRKTTVRIFQATSWQNLSRENFDIVTKGKSQKIN